MTKKIFLPVAILLTFFMLATSTMANTVSMSGNNTPTSQDMDLLFGKDKVLLSEVSPLTISELQNTEGTWVWGAVGAAGGLAYYAWSTPRSQWSWGGAALSAGSGFLTTSGLGTAYKIARYGSSTLKLGSRVFKIAKHGAHHKFKTGFRKHIQVTTFKKSVSNSHRNWYRPYGRSYRTRR